MNMQLRISLRPSCKFFAVAASSLKSKLSYEFSTSMHLQ